MFKFKEIVEKLKLEGSPIIAGAKREERPYVKQREERSYVKQH